jgi:hypothetical protein
VTPFMITILIVVVVAILIVIGYLNNVVEANKLQKSRLKLELTGRLTSSICLPVSS